LKQDFFALFVKLSDWQRSLTSMNLKALPLDDPWLMLEAARALNVKRIVFTSAKGVYGPVTGEYGSPTWKPMSEDLPAKPKRIYDSAKFMGENVCAYYNDNMGIETVSLRFASTYGPGKTARHGPMAVMRLLSG